MFRVETMRQIEMGYLSGFTNVESVLSRIMVCTVRGCIRAAHEFTRVHYILKFIKYTPAPHPGPTFRNWHCPRRDHRQDQMAVVDI